MAANEYYVPTGQPSQGSQGASVLMRAEFEFIRDGFGKLPDLAGNANRAVFINGSGAGMTAVTAATARGLLDLEPGVDVQTYDAGLDSIAGLVTAADKMIYTTAPDTYAVADLTSYGRSIVATANEAAFKALVNLEIGVDVQAYNGNLAAIAGLASAADRGLYFTGAAAAAVFTLTAAGRALLDDADNSAQRTTLGLGTMATQNSGSVSITGGAISGITDLAIADGGTGASTAANARTNLGLEIGVDVQAFDADLSALAGNATNGLWARTGAGTGAARTLTGTVGQVTVTNGDGVAGNPTISLPADVLIPTVLTVPNTGLHILDTNASHDLIIQAGSDLTADRTLTITTGDAARTLNISAANVTISSFGATLVDDADQATARTTLGLVIGTNVQAFDAGLNSIAALVTAADRMIYTTASDTYAVTTLSAFARTVLDDGDAATARATLGAAASGAVTGSGLTMTSARLLGRQTASTGAIEEITIGSGLQLNAGALEVTLAGGSVTSVDVSGGTTGLTFSGGPVSTAGTITMAGTLAIANGGTGSTSAANARTALGLAIGSQVQAWDADLDALAALAATAGMLARTGAGAFAVRTLTAPAAGITISNGDGAAGNPTLALANDLAAVEGLATTGLVRRTGADTWTAGTTVATAEIANNAVDNTKIRDSAAVSVIGRSANSAGDPADIAAGSNDTILRRTSDTLNWGQITVGMLPNDLVTYAKIQNVSATDRLLGRATIGAGDIEEIICTAAGRALLDDADNTAQRSTLGLGALAVLAAVDTAQIQDDAVTYAKMQNMTSGRVLGRTTASSGNVEELSAGTGISFSAGAISVSTVPVANGGTGANAAADARTNLGLAIGIDVQAYDADTAKLDVEDQVLTGGAIVTSKNLGTISSGTVTPDPGDRPLQHYTNGGAHTLAPSTNAGSMLVDITNNASAGAITTSGFTRVIGDLFTTTDGHKFRCHISVGNAGSILSVSALQ